MEQDFAGRLKHYRRARGLTQQDLADALGVSNKTVSRWESGGWPDPPLLVPLARALGVSLDDLMDGEKPIRTLTKADYQSLLSFAFALGGGLLYFLFDLFAPALLCYLAYLACMAYGVHLQRCYAYRSHWFWLGNAVLDFSVNLAFSSRVFSWAAALWLAGGSVDLVAAGLQRGLSWAWPLLGAALVLAAAATLLTLALVQRAGLRGPVALRVPALRDLVSALCALLLCGFWLCFDPERLPLWAVLHQRALYCGLLAVFTALCLLLCLRRRRMAGLCQTGALVLGGLALPLLAQEWACLTFNQTFLQVAAYGGEVGEEFPRFGRYAPEQLAVTLAVAVLCLLPAVVGRGEDPRL